MPTKRRHKILVVDDEIGIRELLLDILSDEGYLAIGARNAEEAWRLRTQEAPDLILLDIWMPDMDGISLLNQWNDAGFARAPVIIMSGHATIESAVEAMKLGAVEVMEKPIATGALLSAVTKALAGGRKADVNPVLQQTNFGSSATMRKLKSQLLDASASASPVFMKGRINCGAEFFARFLRSSRAPVAYVENGAQLEGDLDLLLRQAENGMLIVRQMGLFNARLQNGLLGLMREAGHRNVRVVVCGTESPAALAEKFRFNDVLLTALSRHVVDVPTLAQCQIDLAVIIDMICAELTTDTDLAGRNLSAAAREALIGRAYENDFAELRSLLRGSFLYSRGNVVDAPTVRMLAAKFSGPAASVEDGMRAMPFRRAREAFEREYFIRLIGQTNGNIPQAAEIAGLERTYFYRKLRQYREESSSGQSPDGAE